MSSIIKSHRISQETVIELGSPKTSVTIIESKTNSIDEEVLVETAKVVLTKAEETAKQIIMDAQQEADELLAKAQEQMQELYYKADEEIARSQEEASSRAARIYSEAEAKAGSMIEEAYKEKEEIIQTMEPEIIQLVQRLVAHIIHEEVATHTEWVGLLLKKIRQVEGLKEPLEMTISREAYEKLSDNQKSQIENLGEGVVLHMDELVAPTACSIQTSHGNIVYDITKGLEMVLKEIEIFQTL